MSEDWTIEDSAEPSPILLITIHAPHAIRLADAEFDSTVWSSDEEFLGHPIQTDPPLQYDTDPSSQVSLMIDVPDPLSADMLVNLEAGTPLTVTFTDPYGVRISPPHLYVITESTDDGGRVTLGIVRAELRYVIHEPGQHSLWSTTHMRPRYVQRVVPARDRRHLRTPVTPIPD